MREPTISKVLLDKVPDLQVLTMELPVHISTETPTLDDKIAVRCKDLVAKMKIEDIAQQVNIHAAREAYKACGKKPSRYRLSAEALMRRALNGKSLYKINNVVDAINYTSLMTGFSIGGYDRDKIVGNVMMGIGEAGEPYQAIGRGALNIEYMPVFRDDIGAFGSMTSDSERTAISGDTNNALFLIVDFGGTGAQIAGKILSEAITWDY